MSHRPPAIRRLILLLVFLGGATVRADIILASTFNTNVISGTNNEFLTVPWTGLEAGTASLLQAIDPGGVNGFAHLGGDGDDVVYLNYNLNISDRADLRGFSFSFTPATSYQLDQLDVDVTHRNSSGGGQSFVSDLHVSISGPGVSYSSIQTNIAYVGGSFQTRNFDLTGEVVSAGQSYTVDVSMNNLVGGGAFFTSDALALQGTVIPEPSVFSILFTGACFLRILRRKRQSITPVMHS